MKDDLRMPLRALSKRFKNLLFVAHKVNGIFDTQLTEAWQCGQVRRTGSGPRGAGADMVTADEDIVDCGSSYAESNNVD